MEIREARLLIQSTLPRRTFLVSLACALLPVHAFARSVASHRESHPDHFHPKNGLRIERYRAPTPDDVPGGTRITVQELKELLKKPAALVDVFGAASSRFDELDGTWLVSKQRESIPGATWLPEVGRGSSGPEMQTYFAGNLKRLTGGDKNCPLILFCIADCWMSWNAVQHATAMGYTQVYWSPSIQSLSTLIKTICVRQESRRSDFGITRKTIKRVATSNRLTNLHNKAR